MNPVEKGQPPRGTVSYVGGVRVITFVYAGNSRLRQQCGPTLIPGRKKEQVATICLPLHEDEFIGARSEIDSSHGNVAIQRQANRVGKSCSEFLLHTLSL